LVPILFGCGTEDPANADGASSASLPAACATLVRETIERADATADTAARITVLEEGLDAMPREGAAHCERELLVELAELHAGTGRTERLISVCEAAIRPGMGLDAEQTARLKMKLARAYFQAGLPRSFDLAKDVFLYLEEMNVRSDRMLEATDLLVNTYDLTGELTECRKLLSEALKKAEAERDIRWTTDLLDRLGVLAVKQGDGKAAVALHERSLTELARFFRNGAVRDTLVRHVQQRQRQGSAGLTTSTDTLTELLTERQYLTMRHRALKLLGDARRAVHADERAAHAYLEATAMAATAQIPELVPPFTELGEIRAAQGDTREAVRLGEQGHADALQRHDPVRAQRAAKLLYQAYKAQGDAVKALHMFELQGQYSDSLNNESFRMGLLKNQVTYEVRDDSLRMSLAIVEGQRDTAFARAEARTNRNRALMVGGVAVLLLIGGGLWWRTDRKRRKERFEKDAARLETQALRSQMNPHFIFNALNSINAYVQKNDQDSASSYLTKFARVMRSVLENSRHAEVPLVQDLETLRGYMDLERKRMQEKFDFTIEVDDALDPEEVMVPPLVVQPFVENAIWHGMAGKEGKGHISLRVEQQGKQLLWIIEDDGVGRQAKKEPLPQPVEGATKKTSLGTAITRSRLDLVQKQYGGKAGFRYVDRPVGTRVEVDMPMHLQH